MKKRPILTILLSIALAEGVGFLSGYLSGDISAVYQSFVQPPFAPPGWLFPIAWGILYALMGIASALIYLNMSDDRTREEALVYYGVQLAVNFSWSIIFFRFRALWLGVVIVLVLDLLVWVTYKKFSKISRTAGTLLIHYLIWLLYATYLTVAIFFLN